jgi:hypothetical protein
VGDLHTNHACAGTHEFLTVAIAASVMPDTEVQVCATWLHNDITTARRADFVSRALIVRLSGSRLGASTLGTGAPAAAVPRASGSAAKGGIETGPDRSAGIRTIVISLSASFRLAVKGEHGHLVRVLEPSLG